MTTSSTSAASVSANIMAAFNGSGSNSSQTPLKSNSNNTKLEPSSSSSKSITQKNVAMKPNGHQQIHPANGYKTPIAPVQQQQQHHNSPMKTQIPIAAKPIAIAAANVTSTAPIAAQPLPKSNTASKAAKNTKDQQKSANPPQINGVGNAAPNQQQLNEQFAQLAAFKQQQQQQGFIQAPYYQLLMNTSGKQVSGGANPIIVPIQGQKPTNSNKPQMPTLQPQQPVMQQHPQPQIQTAQSQTPTYFSATPTADGQLIIVPLNATQTPSVDYNQQIMMNLLNQQKQLLNQQHAQQQQQQQQQQAMFFNPLQFAANSAAANAAQAVKPGTIAPNNTILQVATTQQQQQQQQQPNNNHEYNELKKQYEEALMKNNKLENQAKKQQMNHQLNKKSPAKMISPKTMPNISPKLNTSNSKQDELNTSSGSHKKIMPALTAMKSPTPRGGGGGGIESSELKMDSNGDEESNTSSASSCCDQSQINTTTNNNASTASNPTTKNANSKKRGRPRLYEMNPTTGKSIKGRLITPITSPNLIKSSPKPQKQGQSSQQPMMHLNPAIHLSNGLTAIFPSPATSTTSSLSPASNNPAASSNPTILINGAHIKAPVSSNSSTPIQYTTDGIQMIANPAYTMLGQPSINLGMIHPHHRMVSPLVVPPMTHSLPPPPPLQPQPTERPTSTDSSSSSSSSSSGTSSSASNSEQEMSCDESPTPSKKENVATAFEEKTNTASMKKNSSNENKENKSNTTGNKVAAVGDEKKPSMNTNFDSPKSNKIITHKIEGYIIKEGSKPFPVKPSKNGATSTNESGANEIASAAANSTMIVDRTPPKSHSTPASNNNNLDASMNSPSTPSSKIKREKHHSSTKKSLTSSSAKKRRTEDGDVEPDTENKSPSKRHHKHGHKHHHHHHRSRSRTNMDGEPMESSESVIAPLPDNMSLLSTMPSSSSLDLPPGDPTEWNCDDVYRFVSSVAGVQVANQFKMQDIDGSALSLIQNDHLVNTMQVKLGPALKIISKFNEVKTRFAAAAARQQLNLSSH